MAKPVRYGVSPEESNEQRRARLQALLADVLDVHRRAAFQLAEAQRVVTDCETAVRRLTHLIETADAPALRPLVSRARV